MPTKYPTVKKIILVEPREDAEVQVYFDCEKPGSVYRYEAKYKVLTGAGILEIVKGASEHAGYGGALCPTAADIDRYLAQAQK